jgi:hypothetical protein
MLQTTADRWRREIAKYVMRIRIAIVRVSEAGEIKNVHGEASEAVFSSIKGLDDVRTRLEKEIKKLDQRAASLREEIDEFFANKPRRRFFRRSAAN